MKIKMISITTAVAGAGKTRKIVENVIETLHTPGASALIVTLTNSVRTEITDRISEQVPVEKNKKGNGNEGGQPPKFFMREPGNRDPVQVNIHPSSVNSKASPSSLNLA